jgi:ABC-type sugar transport system substrate-binding protein
MKGRRSRIILCVLAISMIVLAACQAQPTEAPAPEEPEEAAEPAGELYHFCVVHNNTDHPSITAVIEGMDDEAAIYNIKVTHFDPAYDPQKQLDMINDCIALDADLVVVNAVDPAAVVAGIKKAVDAGKPVIMNNADTNEEGQKYTLSFIGASAYEQGLALGKIMVEELEDGAKGVVISGKPGQTGVIERMQGVTEMLDESGLDYEFLDEQPADWMADKALTVMQDFLTRFPSGEIDFVLALDDPMAIGALEAIKAADRLGEMKVFGFNGNKEACDAIKAGEMHGTALSLSYLSGVETIRVGYDVMVGRMVNERYTSPTAGLTADNIDEWYDQCW